MRAQILSSLKRYCYDTPSIFLLMLPYFFIIYRDIELSADFSLIYFLLTLLFFALIDIVFRLLYRKAKKKRDFLIFNFIYTCFFVFFYSSFFPLQFAIVKSRFIIALYFLIVYLFLAFFKKAYPFINRLAIILCVIIFINQTYKTHQNKTLVNKTIKRKILVSSQSDKPIILIIMDEYASPVQLKKNGMPVCCPDLLNYLGSTNWITNPTSYSFETNTIHSISSIYNYNLVQNEGYSGESDENIATNLKKAQVIRDLYKKKILFKNYSFFSLGNNSYYRYIYALPTNFIELFLCNSMYLIIKLSAKSPVLHNLTPYSTEDYNNDVYQKINEILNQPGRPRQFVYLHLLMPHWPFKFADEINLNENSEQNYYKYWLFTNNKIIEALRKAKDLSDYRIIISGDHGYRGDKKIDPHQTITAFYGFNKADISQLQSVQDIGILIERSFK